MIRPTGPGPNPLRFIQAPSVHGGCNLYCTRYHVTGEGGVTQAGKRDKMDSSAENGMRP